MSEKTSGTCYFGILPAHEHLQVSSIVGAYQWMLKRSVAGGRWNSTGGRSKVT